MRRDPQTAVIMGIVISVGNLPADVQIGWEAGASIHVAKMVGYFDLVRAMTKVLGR